MSSDQVADKVRAHAQGRVALAEIEAHLARWQDLVDEDDVGRTLGTLVVRPEHS